jgi:hypothetical protein
MIVNDRWQVFWLVPVSEAFPSVKTVTGFQKHVAGLTAAGTAPALNRIPY